DPDRSRDPDARRHQTRRPVAHRKRATDSSHVRRGDGRTRTGIRQQRRRGARRGGDQEEGAADRAPHAEDRPQRSLPLRFGQEIQALPRQTDLMAVNLAPPDPASLHPVRGVELGVAMAGVRKPNRKDLLVIRLAAGSAVAAVFTQNRFCAAPVVIAKRHLRNAAVRALVVNTGNANAGTGAEGLQRALQVCEALADHLGCEPHDILPFSTGVIMEPLPAERITAALPKALLDKSDWLSAAEAIMTT